MSHLRSESVDRLFQTILNLGSIDECYAYFEDLCTIKEVKDMAQRLDTAILLSQGCSYQKIMEQIEISTATIGRVSRSLNYGTGGYRTAIEKLNAKEETV
jgi:TrpR-related protein YerC/YecD